MTRCIVIGMGSIGLRHVAVLRELRCRVSCVSRRGEADYRTIAEAIRGEAPSYAVIATETSDHARALAQLHDCGFRGTVIVEKPLFVEPQDFPWRDFHKVVVAYPLRCHPALARLKQILGHQPVLSAQLYVGQYLPDWRPGLDYRTCYSACAAKGGGALRDLSHELDIANWLFGPWTSLTARGGHWSDLEIDSDDHFVVLGAFKRCRAATIHLNYLDRPYRRQIVVNTADHTYDLDFAARTLRCDGQLVETFEIERNAIFSELHRAVLADDTTMLANVTDGMLVMDMIAAAERAGRDNIWITRGQT